MEADWIEARTRLQRGKDLLVTSSNSLRNAFKNLVVGVPEDLMADKATREQVRPPEAAADRLQKSNQFQFIAGGELSIMYSALLRGGLSRKKATYIATSVAEGNREC